MTYSMKYSPQGTSQNKKRLREFLEQKDVSLDTVTVSYMQKFPQYHGNIEYGPEIVPFEDLPADIQECTVLVDGEIRWEVEIGSSKLTATGPSSL